MTGEMSKEEVTRDNYPELFQVKEVLVGHDVGCQELPFDQYQGPFLDCEVDNMDFEIWYHGESPGALVAKFKTLDNRTAFLEFFPDGADSLIHEIKYYRRYEIYTFEPDEIKAFEVDFNRNIKKFAEWLDMQKPRDFHRRPTLKEYIPLMTIGVNPWVIPERNWEEMYDKLFAFLQNEDMKHFQEHNFSIERHFKALAESEE